MNSPSDVPPPSPLDPQVAVPPNVAATRPMYWSIRRELWENRSITLAPLAVAAFVLFALLITVLTLPRRLQTLPALEPAKQHAAVVRPFGIAPAPIMVATILVGLFYSLDALYGERRDRSILFWKALPVSDRTTVLSKAAIPLVVLPLIGLALSVMTQAVILLWTTVVILGNGLSPAALWADGQFLQIPLVLLYGVAAFTLWHAPIYGWFLLVSGWAPRTPVLWAVLPLFAVSLVEKAAFNTWHFASLLRERLGGALEAAFTVASTKSGAARDIDRLAQIDPARFLTTPGLWIGLAFTAAFLATAVRLRRSREPI